MAEGLKASTAWDGGAEGKRVEVLSQEAWTPGNAGLQLPKTAEDGPVPVR